MYILYVSAYTHVMISDYIASIFSKYNKKSWARFFSSTVYPNLHVLFYWKEVQTMP